MSNRLRLAFACEAYDRTLALRTGEVRPDGIDLNYLTLPVEETFFRMAQFGEFDVAEMSLSTYVVMLNRDPRPFVAIPVFPSRSFRHGGIYVNTSAGISTPADLVGKRVGLGEYQLTANVWIRGILAEHYDVPVDSVSYRTGGLHAPGRYEKVSTTHPETLDIAPIGEGKTLSQMLVDGELDAIYSPRTPQPFTDHRPEVSRLFPEARDVEAEYFRTTGIFPIMHVIAIRAEVYQANPWIARSLQKAFIEAKDRCFTGIDETASLRYALPWLAEEVARTRSVMGEDFWSYGNVDNDPALSKFLEYSWQQSLAGKQWQPRDLFVPEALAEVIV